MDTSNRSVSLWQLQLWLWLQKCLQTHSVPSKTMHPAPTRLGGDLLQQVIWILTVLPVPAWTLTAILMESHLLQLQRLPPVFGRTGGHTEDTDVCKSVNQPKKEGKKAEAFQWAVLNPWFITKITEGSSRFAYFSPALLADFVTLCTFGLPSRFTTFKCRKTEVHLNRDLHRDGQAQKIKLGPHFTRSSAKRSNCQCRWLVGAWMLYRDGFSSLPPAAASWEDTSMSHSWCC